MRPVNDVCGLPVAAEFDERSGEHAAHTCRYIPAGRSPSPRRIHAGASHSLHTALRMPR
ncbi:hypothetical protein SBD_5882 [Streptomyces bottropensis ATCC 25435]|uniref:Uncharacterized protein n=1 Tax=Streptomyces bottropensis ATCC 25435 TaxID=1054862 RepID=M3FIR1_9ACTN|nr:hypothetical protein SBD_5882 [Streptomyces bottropensis ATCC 25435]